MGDFLNFMAYFGDFLVAPPATLEVFRWYMSRQSFIHVRLLVPKFSNIKCFDSIRKYNFRPLVDGLLKVNP